MKISSLARIVVLFLLVVLFGCSSKLVDITGVEFASENRFELANSYQDMLSLTVTAPSAGYVTLTGSGYFGFAYTGGTGWAGISIGKISGAANSENEIGIEIPSGSVVGNYNMPFSLTCVMPVSEGDNRFYMVGIKDANPHTVSANNLKLTAIFVPRRL